MPLWTWRPSSRTPLLTLYDDFDVSLTELFEANNLFFSKVNAIKSDFAYLCDVLPNGYSYCNDHFMHIFDINYVQTETFNLGTIKNPKNILIASDITSDESKKNERNFNKKTESIRLGL